MALSTTYRMINMKMQNGFQLLKSNLRERQKEKARARLREYYMPKIALIALLFCPFSFPAV